MASETRNLSFHPFGKIPLLHRGCPYLWRDPAFGSLHPQSGDKERAFSGAIREKVEVFTGPNQFAIASALVPLVQVLQARAGRRKGKGARGRLAQVLFFPVARPIAAAPLLSSPRSSLLPAQSLPSKANVLDQMFKDEAQRPSGRGRSLTSPIAVVGLFGCLLGYFVGSFVG